MYFLAHYFLYSEVFDRAPDLSELLTVIRDLDPAEASILLCQVNADLRLTKKEKEAVGKLQQELAAHLLDDGTINRFKQRFGQIHLADRPVFHPPQILNVLRLVLQHSAGSEKPLTDTTARYKLGKACLMMNDLLLTSQEESEITSGTDEAKMRSMMTQMMGSFEVINTAAITHVIYRARIMFHDLLAQEAVANRIRNECGGFDFEQEFLRIVGIPLSRWLFLLFAFYSYLMHYCGQDSARHPEFLCIERPKFRGESRFTQAEMDLVLQSISSTRDDFSQMLGEMRPTDWRFDFIPFRSKPLIELQPDKYFCGDIGFLAEKMHSGVYWAINDGLNSSERPRLFKAWGILFEEYVNWFLGDRQFKQPLFFWPSPKWLDGRESVDGVLMQDSRFMPMEYKGSFLKIEARCSGNKEAFESDLDLKIVEGCRQLAWKIEALFNMEARGRKKLRDIPLHHITRVVPVLIVQDYILRGPFINWWLNKKFAELLDRTVLRLGVTVDSLNLISIHELETMAESAEAGEFDVFRGLQVRCYTDPEMRSELHNFLLTIPGYGVGKSERIERILDEQWEEIEEYLFGGQEKTC